MQFTYNVESNHKSKQNEGYLLRIQKEQNSSRNEAPSANVFGRQHFL